MPFSEFERIEAEKLHRIYQPSPPTSIPGFSFEKMHHEYMSGKKDGLYSTFKGVSEKIRNEVLEGRNSIKDSGELIDEVFYRTLAVLSVNPSESDRRWFSKDLVRSEILKCFENSFSHEDIRSIYNLGEVGKMETEVIRRLYDTGFGKYNYSLSAVEDTPLVPELQSFIDHNNYRELTEVLLAIGYRADGSYQSMGKGAAVFEGVAKVLNHLTGRANIGSHDIKALVASGEIEPKSLWDTDHFNEFLAPQVTDESQAKAKAYTERFNKGSLFEKLKESLAPNEIFNYFIYDNLGDIRSWETAMNRYAAETGHRISFQEARDMKPFHGFRLSSTEAYAQHVDDNFNPDDWSSFTIDVEDEERDYKDGPNLKSFTINAKFCRDEDIENKIQDILLSEERGYSSASGIDCVTLTFEVPEKGHKEISAVVKALTEVISKEVCGILSSHLLPGDIAVVKSSEWEEDYNELIEGKKFLVTDLSDGEIKLKGVSQYFPIEAFEIKKKRVPRLEMNASMEMMA